MYAIRSYYVLAAQFFEVVAWVGAITALLLATQGMVNSEIKKVLAYSTGSQIGYMMMALGVAGLSDRITSYNVCYTKLLRRIRMASPQ